MWSVGCIMAELYTGKPLFPGKSKEDQLAKIFSLLGTPTATNWPELSREFPDFKAPAGRISSTCPVDLKKTLSGQGNQLCSEGFDLLMRFLTFSPKGRISASEALKHRFFQDIVIGEFRKY